MLTAQGYTQTTSQNFDTGAHHPNYRYRTIFREEKLRMPGLLSTLLQR